MYDQGERVKEKWNDRRCVVTPELELERRLPQETLRSCLNTGYTGCADIRETERRLDMTRVNKLLKIYRRNGGSTTSRLEHRQNRMDVRWYDVRCHRRSVTWTVWLLRRPHIHTLN